MRIAIDASPAVHQRAGIGRYTLELCRALLALEPAVDWYAFYNRSQEVPQLTPPFSGMHPLTLRQGDKPWRLQVALAHMTGQSQDGLFSGMDCFHATDHLLPRLDSIPSVFTLHDLTFWTHPRTHLSLNRWFNRLLLPSFLRQAHTVIVPSICTGRDVERLYPWAGAKVRVIYEAAHPRFRPLREQEWQHVREKFGLQEKFILFVGTIEPRKNLTLLLEGLSYLHQRGLPHHLVIAGKVGWNSNSFFQRLKELKLENWVQILGFVQDEDLPGLYNAADLFVYPSLYEGFGLPVLEALACGTPTVCSNAASLPEIAGSAARLLPPLEGDAWKKTLEAILSDSALQAEMRLAGPPQAAQFSWERAARETLAVYRGLK